MKKSLLVKLLSLILTLCAVFTLFSACGDSSSRDDDEKTTTKCSHEYADEYTCHDRECLECGKVKQATTEHTFADNFTCHDRQCECGYIEQATTEHEYENGYCACGDHTHVFNEQIVTSDFLDKAATCEKKATYFYSCSCGQKGSETFEHGDFANHEYTELKRNENIHWYECKCGYWDGSLADHFYVTKHNEYMHWGECMCGQIGIEEEHKGGTATCTQLATCSECYVEYGELGDHKFENGFCECGEIYVDPNLQFALINEGTEYAVTGYDGAATEVIIPSKYNDKDVTSIGYYAFYNCLNIINIEIPDSVKEIGRYAFSHCESLENIVIPENVSVLEQGVFDGCTSLITVELPYNLSSIEDYAFRYSSILQAIDIPKDIKSIGCESFYGCDSLTKVNYLGAIDEWVEIEFDRDYSNPTCYAGDLYINDQLIVEAKLTSATKIADYAFYNCISLTKIEMSNNITSIGSFALFNCESLEMIDISSNIASIGYNAFYNCGSLTKVNYLGTIDEWVEIEFVYGDSNPICYADGLYIDNQLVTDVKLINANNISSYAFYYYDLLETIEISNSIKAIGYQAFLGCDSLIKVNYLGTIAEWVEIKFFDVYSNPICYTGDLYINDQLVVEATLTTATEITNYAFNNCDSLTSVTIGDSVTSIGGEAFSGCHSLKSVVIGNNVTNINDHAFMNCWSLVHVEISENLVNIGYRAFMNCWSLTSVEISHKVTNIDSEVFANCSSLTIYCEAESKPSGWDSDWNPDDRPVVWGYKGN